MLDRLRGLVPLDQPWPVRAAFVFYVIHLLLLPRVSGTEIALFLALVFLLIARRRGDIAWTFHDSYAAIALYTLASVASAVAAPDPAASIRQASDAGILLALPVGLTLLRAHRAAGEVSLYALAAMAAIQSVIGFTQFVERGWVLEHRITGSASHVMSFAGLLLPVSLLALIWGIERRRAIVLACGVLATAALGLSMTRSAWFGWLVGLLLYLVFRRRRWLIVLVPAAVVVIVLSPLALFGRLVSSFDPNQSSNLDRIRMAQAGVEMIRDHPLLGLGPGNVRPSYPIYRQQDAPRFSVPHLHNNPIQIWAERGVIALFAYGLLIVLVLRDCARSVLGGTEEAAWGLGCGAAVVGLTVAGLFEFNFGDSEVLLCLLAVSSIAFRRVVDSERPVG